MKAPCATVTVAEDFVNPVAATVSVDVVLMKRMFVAVKVEDWSGSLNTRDTALVACALVDPAEGTEEVSVGAVVSAVVPCTESNHVLPSSAK